MTLVDVQHIRKSSLVACSTDSDNIGNTLGKEKLQFVPKDTVPTWGRKTNDDKKASPNGFEIDLNHHNQPVSTIFHIHMYVLM